jgi:tripeptide aminopeptidase
MNVIAENGLPHPPLELLFTVSEEQGLLGAKNFDFSRLAALQGYALDSGGAPGTVVIKSPCQNEIEYRVFGRSAHAGINPEDGINAIQVMSKALAVMPCGRIDAETTCNFGIIKGGMARNIVAAECYVKGEARSLNRSRLSQITEELTSVFERHVESNGGRAETEVTFLYPEITLEPDEEVVARVVKAAEQNGLPPQLISTGGGSDASIINGHNIRCVNLGIGMTAVHTLDESIKIEDLVNVSRLILGIIELAAQG